MNALADILRKIYPSSVASGTMGHQKDDVSTARLRSSEDLIYKDQDDIAEMRRSKKASNRVIRRQTSDGQLGMNVLNWTHIDLDSMLEMMLWTRSDSVPDEAGNEEAVANAISTGVRMRDFGARITQAETAATPESIPEIFRAYDKALLYHYVRWLYSRGVFDIPHASLTVEDVDRLYTLGYLRRQADFVTGRAMIAHGAYRRALRGTGRPTYYGQLLPERAQWTIAANAMPPTDEEIGRFIKRSEKARMEEATNGEYSVYRMLPYLRPRLTDEWKLHRAEVFGLFGLKHVGISDELALKLIRIPDLSYFPPESVSTHPGDKDKVKQLGDSGKSDGVVCRKSCRLSENPEGSSRTKSEDSSEACVLDASKPRQKRSFDEDIASNVGYLDSSSKRSKNCA